jgi:lactoylglutathione lyase
VLDHTGVVVADLERSVRFYVDVLGLTVATRFTMGSEHLVFLRAGGAWVELIHDARVRPPGGVVDHLALRVEELDAWVRRLRERGVTLLDEQPIEVEELSARIIFCLGPDGERIELIERR